MRDIYNIFNETNSDNKKDTITLQYELPVTLMKKLTIASLLVDVPRREAVIIAITKFVHDVLPEEYQEKPKET